MREEGNVDLPRAAPRQEGVAVGYSGSQRTVVVEELLLARLFLATRGRMYVLCSLSAGVTHLRQPGNTDQVGTPPP